MKIIVLQKFKNYSNLDELKQNFKKDNFQFPFVWKSSKFGYDGKGVKIIKNQEDLDFSYNEQCLVEEIVLIEKELSVIVSRNVKGSVKCFPIVEMEFNEKSNLVEYVMCPANISSDVRKKAIEIAVKTAEKFIVPQKYKLCYCSTIAAALQQLEFFV